MKRLFSLIILLMVLLDSTSQEIKNPSDTVFLHFRPESIKLDKNAKRLLDYLASSAVNDSSNAIKLLNSRGYHCEDCGKISIERMDRTLKYLISKGVRIDRLITSEWMGDDFNKIAIITGTLISLPPALPHPNLKGNNP